MTSFSRSNNPVIENHVDRHGSGHRQHQPDFETGSIHSHSSSRSKSRQHGRGDPSARTRDELDPRRRPHEPRSRNDSGASHGSYANGSRTDSPRRRSSRHCDEDLTGQLTDSSRTSERRSSASHRTNDSQSPLMQRKSRHGQRESERRMQDRAEYQDGTLDPRRADNSPRYHPDRSSHRDERASRSATQRDSNGIRTHPNQTLRRSSSRDHGEPALRRSNSRDHGEPTLRRSNSRDHGEPTLRRSNSRDHGEPTVRRSNSRDYGEPLLRRSNSRDHGEPALRRSTSRDYGDSEGERRERKSHGHPRGRGDEERNSHQDVNGRHRSSSVIRDQDDVDYSRGHRLSSQTPRENRSEYPQDPRPKRRPSRSEYESGEDRRERMSSRSEQRLNDNRGDHRKDNSEIRSKCKDESRGQRVRRRSASVNRDENSYYDTPYETAHTIAHSRNHSSSKQSLAKDEMESFHRSSEPPTRHESHTSKQRHSNERHHTSEAPNCQRRSTAMSDYIDNTNDTLSQTTSNTAISKEAAQVQRAETGRHSDKSPSVREETCSLQSRETVPRNNSSLNDEEQMVLRSGKRSSSRHNISSSNRRRSVSSYEDQEGMGVPTNRHDVSLSRRSSSSRSNQDTGFASSSSSPRRDDSQSRFSSDASPSHFGEDEGFRSRVEESRRRRRSKIVSNNSLDVPGASLRKEQSLSSSGRGDSSFEEPCTENSPNVRGNRRNVEHPRNEKSHHNKDSNTTSGYPDSQSNRLKDVRNDVKSSNSTLHDGLLASKNTSRSSSSIAKENSDTPKTLSKADVAEWASSTSTLRAGNVASKPSIAGSISSLLGRGNKDPQEDTSTPPTVMSVSERWRRLKQGVLPDKDLTTGGLTGKETAAAIFSAAAAKFMSSLPRVPNSLTKTMTQAPVPPADTEKKEPQQLPLNDSSASLPKTDNSSVSKAKSEISVASRTKSEVSGNSCTKSDASVISQIKANDISVPAKTSPTPKVPSRVTSNHSVASMNAVNNNIALQRPSIISTTLSSHNKRVNVYAVMTERKASPDSEESGEMTPPPLDADMKRRSKEVDMELTSFLPAEMSRREEKFHDAARANDADAIRNLLKERVNVNCRNSLDRTALHWAAANGNLEAAEALIESGADLEAKDKYGMRALLWAAWFGHISVLKALVNAGANTRVTNKQGLGILHCAAENNHVSVISFVFEALEPHDVNQRDKNDRTALQSAAEGGHVEAVERLLCAKADLHKKDKGGMTAVHLAAKNGHIDVLKKLLLQGVEVDDRDVDGKTALHLAAEAGYKEAVDLLLDYTASPNSETVKEVTPLHLAAQEGRVEVCRSLVKYGCNVNAQNFQGSTALHIAANGNHKEVARVLIDAKCELDLSNTRMQTPLHVAVESGHLEVVQILLAGGASLDTREKSGKSALQLAARGNYVAVVDMLIKAERYYANTRDYHDKDVGYVDPDTYLRKPQHPHAPQMKDVLWKLATKQLKPSDWKKLAYHWHFTPEHVRAIEQEYTGTTSYKEHSYRLLNIWLHGVRKDENVLKLLYEALVAIDKKQLAESVRRKVNLEAEKPCSPSLCLVS